MKNWQTWIWILVAAAGWGFVLHKARTGAWTTHQIVGMAIAVPAFCLWALARLQLGRSFSISAQAKELVTHGLYSKIQNPVYVFGGILIAAVFVYLGQPYLFLILIILIVMQVMRIRAERRVLEEKFGDAYREYRKHTWF
ncbi:MAG: methyltransferase family protein [Candidatus Acidiferrales bacterium]